MKIESIYGHVVELLEGVLARPQVPAPSIVAPFFRERRYLGSRDRGMIAETLYGTLRGIIRYGFIVSGDFSRPVPKRASEYLALHLLEAARVQTESDEGGSDDPSPGSVTHEAIIGGCRLSRSHVESLAKASDELHSDLPEMPEPERSAIRHGVPVWLAERVRAQYGELSDSILHALDVEAPITLRVNRLKTSPERLQNGLSDRGINSRRGDYSHDALHLEKRMNANSLPEFKNGDFELQDEASQLVSQLLDPRPNWRVIDVCAGAGGKALHLASLMRGRGEVFAHDVNLNRLKRLRPRLKRSGAQNLRLLYPDQLKSDWSQYTGTFDAVLIDAPCTGTGVLRRNPGAVLTLDQAMLYRVNRLQREILSRYAPLVKPGGLLVYATCSLLLEENEHVVADFLDQEQAWRQEPFNGTSLPADMFTGNGDFRPLPHLHGTDGFFAAQLRLRGPGA